MTNEHLTRLRLRAEREILESGYVHIDTQIELHKAQEKEAIVL